MARKYTNKEISHRIRANKDKLKLVKGANKDKLKLVKEKVRGLSIRQTDLKNKIDNDVDLLTSRFIGSARKFIGSARKRNK